MRRHLLNLAVIFFSLGMLLSGLQSIAGYYSDPSGYGFYHIQGGYFNVSMAVVLLGGIVVVKAIKRVERLLW